VTRRDKVALAFLLPGIACFVVAGLPPIENGPLNVVLTFAGIGLVILGFLRMRNMPDA